MYSKYLDYTEGAVRAHQAAQVENDQKDVLIAHLKSEVYELKQLEGDFMRLDNLIMSIDEKYSLLLDEKERTEKEQRVKNEIDKSSIIGLKEEIEGIQIQLQKASMEIDDLMRENTTMKRMADARASEIQNIRYEIKNLETKNDRVHQENKDIASSIKLLKEERRKLEEKCESIDSHLDSNISKLKNVEKQVRNSESTNARYDKTLHQAENDNIKLVAELKQKNEEAKRTEIKLNSLKSNVEDLKNAHQNLLHQAEKNKSDSGASAANLANEVAAGKELNNKLSNIEGKIRIQESELDSIVIEEERLRKEHYLGIETNRGNNAEIDKILALIHEYEQLNKELLDELEIYIDQDEQARAILNRKDRMRDIIETSLRKISISSEPIKHLKY